MTRSVWATISAFGLVLWSVTSNSFAEDPYRNVVRNSANKIKAVMDSIRAESVTLQNFTDKTTFGATVLPGIKQLLEAELKSAAAIVKPEGGAVGVSAALSIAKNLDSSSADTKQLRIEFTILDRFGEGLDSADGIFAYTQTSPQSAESAKFKLDQAKFSDGFASPSALLIGYGANADLDRYGDSRSSLKPFLDSMDDPTSVIDGGSTAKASSTSPFGLQVVANGKLKALRKVDGKPFVDFVVGEEFSVSLLNESKEQVMATLSLDGLNSFFKSQEKGKHGDSWVLSPKQSAAVPGFYVNSGIAKRFTATTFERSERAKAGLSETPLGAITVAIYDTVRVEPKPDTVTIARADGTTTTEVRTRKVKKSVTRSDSSTPDIYIAGGDETVTSVGPPVPVREGKLRAVISIRYRHPESKSQR